MKFSRNLLDAPWKFALALLLVLPLFSCADDEDADARLQQLRRNQRLWYSRAIVDYQIVQQRFCFCDPRSLDPIQVEIRDGEVVRAAAVEGGVPVPSSHGMTVEDLFGRIEQAIENDYEYLETTYDPGFGFPMEISMNPGGGIQDAGWGMTCSTMSPLEPEESCDPPPAFPPCDCPAEFPALAYRYTAWDDSGAVVATGCASLTFTVRAGSDPAVRDVTGSRCFTVRCLTDVQSAHQGRYDVSGELAADGEFRADPNAGGWTDHNISLSATGIDYWGSHIGGTWTESGFGGPVDEGTFLLERTGQ
ncbi:MAG: hypothetical protein FD129_674 [bacterium]|nr:MAG: hypothetical protein FD129_674 [bacterium]